VVGIELAIPAVPGRDVGIEGVADGGGDDESLALGRVVEGSIQHARFDELRQRRVLLGQRQVALLVEALLLGQERGAEVLAQQSTDGRAAGVRRHDEEESQLA
jgi:hypothetical protein